MKQSNWVDKLVILSALGCVLFIFTQMHISYRNVHDVPYANSVAIGDLLFNRSSNDALVSNEIGASANYAAQQHIDWQGGDMFARAVD